MDRSRGSTITLCAIVRDEGPYLLEWIAWYKLLGFDRIVIYDNESRDEGAVLLAALHRAGEIDHRPWPDQPDEQPQLPAYRDAITRCSTEWIAFLDVDEFLVLHHARRIADLLVGLPDDCSAVAFNQRFFGSSGLLHYDDRLVVERFTRTSRPDHFLNVWVKSIARTDRIATIGSPHGFELKSGYYAEPGGNPCILKSYCQTQAISLSVAQYNHYILKSRDEFLQKQSRGRVDVPRAHPERFNKYTDAFFVLHDENVCEDDSASRHGDQVRTEWDRLHGLALG